MGRTFAIVVTAALVGGIAGAAIGIAVDGGRSSSSNPTAAPVVGEPTSHVHTAAALSPEAIYRADSPAVVEIEGITSSSRSCVAPRSGPSTSRSATCPGSRAAYHD